jgi:hypothetical protein
MPLSRLLLSALGDLAARRGRPESGRASSSLVVAKDPPAQVCISGEAQHWRTRLRPFQTTPSPCEQQDRLANRWESSLSHAILRLYPRLDAPAETATLKCRTQSQNLLLAQSSAIEKVDQR